MSIKGHVIRNLTQKRCEAQTAIGQRCTRAALDGLTKCRGHQFGNQCKPDCRCFSCASRRLRVAGK